jgi:hypothetical protein
VCETTIQTLDSQTVVFSVYPARACAKTRKVMVFQLLAPLICALVSFSVGFAAVSDVDLAGFSPGPTSGWLGYGYNSEGNLGRTFKPGGDFNGDGMPDALLGGSAQHYGGAVYVVFGTRSFGTSVVDTASPARPFVLPPGTGITIYSNNYYDACGQYLDGGADFNGDGFDDVAVGCSGAAPNGYYQAGSVFVVFGHGAPYADVDVYTMTRGSQGFVINGLGYYSQLARVAFADVNGDGLSDLVVGEPSFYYYSGYGHVYVLLGKRSNTYQTVNVASFDFDGVVGFKLQGHVNDDHLGTLVSSVGDHNGDGYEDFAVQAAGVDNNGNSDVGALYVIFGRSSATAFDTNIDVNTIPTDALKGFCVYGPANQGPIAPSSSPGDINGDGISDLVVNTAYSSDSNRGTTYVLFGHTGTFFNVDLLKYTFTSSKGYRIVGANAWNAAVGDFAGDVNGDGYDDIIVSSGEPKPGRAGSVTAYVLFSHGPGVAYSDISLNTFVTGGTTGYKIYGPAAYDGWLNNGKLGDINGDGADDVGFALPAANTPSGQYRAGIAWLVLSASVAPTAGPTARPTAGPTVTRTARPTPEGWTDIPTVTPTARPTLGPTVRPTTSPTEATAEPTAEPSAEPTAEPTAVVLKSGRGQLEVVQVRIQTPLSSFHGYRSLTIGRLSLWFRGSGASPTMTTRRLPESATRIFCRP